MRRPRRARRPASSGARSCRARSAGRARACTSIRSFPTRRSSDLSSTLLLEHEIRLDPAARYLMRCDRVEFDPGGEALPHRHKGGGIRCLIGGTLQVRVEGEPERTIKPGEAWFESGREPVYAKASASEATSFIRCSILPREIRWQSSRVHVDPLFPYTTLFRSELDAVARARDPAGPGGALPDALRSCRIRPGRRGAAAPPQGRWDPLPDRRDATGSRGRRARAHDQAGRSVVRERARARVCEGLGERGDQLHPVLDPAARDPLAELARARRSALSLHDALPI